jgi:hypothetical protein
VVGKFRTVVMPEVELGVRVELSEEKRREKKKMISMTDKPKRAKAH